MLKFIVKKQWIKTDISKPIKKSLSQSVELVRWKAVQNSPYQTWNLRRSITTALALNKDEWIVGK